MATAVLGLGSGTTVYSFKDTVGAFVSLLAGPFVLAGGNVGAGQFVIDMTTARSEQDTASDGAVMVTYIAGESGTFTVECQQTSALHKYFLGAFNLHKTAANAHDVSNWASSAVQLRNVTDGSQHILTGVSFSKIPPKTYAGRGGLITWTFLAANVVNL
jgi:hypothetical protein